MSDTGSLLGSPTRGHLIALTVPALLIGLISGGMLALVDVIAHGIQHVLWETLPHAWGADPDSGWWIFGTLTVIGVLVGLVIWLVPGHAEPDSATVELAVPPQPLWAVPGIALATVLTLAGGVSLGPEGPIIAINVSLCAWLMTRLWHAFPPQLAVILASSATIGALFGTPVAAALVLTGTLAALPGKGSLWDRLFLPLVSAAAGAMISNLLGAGMGELGGFGEYTPRPIDLLWGAIIATVSAAFGLIAVYGLPVLHRFARRVLRHRFLVPAVGGVLLGILGAIGGPITLFKGLDQSATLLAAHDEVTGWQLVVILVVKMAALLVAAAFSFRGGRVFPAVFLGVAAGMLGQVLLPDTPLSLAVAAGVIGLTLAIARDGWIALFVAVAMVGDVSMLPVLCVIILPAWLVVTASPDMIVEEHEPATGVRA
ncbi:ion channel protein [Microbacterium terricola]|uniref:Ion-transport protein YfeO n=1 Tax=Microbacterium terricola TaxID=344163 RepID=A0ABM8E356_9MICO|nr:ion channel protein [Microbacterium terricola]UYK40106.1 ion channel protein [Microbacterium terricola]BDV32192.1 putative ion-transport protein YfeO [Microbacterium terricola]